MSFNIKTYDDKSVNISSKKYKGSQIIDVVSKNYNYEVAMSRVEGDSTWNKFGYNNDVDTGADEVVAAFGGAFNQRLNSAETLNISSTSAQDTLTTGTGAWQLVLYYVDSNWNEGIEVISLNGTNTVTTNAKIIGINRVSIFKSGSSLSNVGEITITASSSGNVMASVPVGSGTTEQAIFYVADKHNFLMDWLFLNVRKLSGGTAPRVTLTGWVYSEVSTSFYDVLKINIDTTIENTIQLNLKQPFVIGPKSIFYLTATTNTNNTVVNARFSGMLSQI